MIPQRTITVLLALLAIGFFAAAFAPSAGADELDGYFADETELADPDAQHEVRMAIAYWTRPDVAAHYGIHGCPTLIVKVIPDGSGAEGWGTDCHAWITADVAILGTPRELAAYDLTTRLDVRLLRNLERQRCRLIRHELGHAFGIGDGPDGPIGTAGLVVDGGHINGDPVMTPYVQDIATPADCDKLARALWRPQTRRHGLRARRASASAGVGAGAIAVARGSR